MSNGFVTKSFAPLERALCFAAGVMSSVSTTIGNQRTWIQGASSSITSYPSGWGMSRSSRIRSGECPAQSATTSDESVVLEELRVAGVPERFREQHHVGLDVVDDEDLCFLESPVVHEVRCQPGGKLLRALLHELLASE